MALTALPILIPFIFIIILILVRSTIWARRIAIFGTILLLLVSVGLFSEVTKRGILTLTMGGWKAPFGITLVIDYLSGLMLIVSAVIALAIALYSTKFIDYPHKSHRFYVFFFSLIMGLNGAFTTGDVFNLYVWFEVMLMSSFVLITLGSKKKQIEGGIKYLALNLIGSMLFLAGLGLLYGKTGTLNMAHLAKILIYDQQSIFMNTSAILFFIAFGIKAAVFPLFFWLPASYHTPNITISSLFAGLLTKVGVYALFRFFTLFFIQDQQFWHTIILVIAGFTMVFGGMAASIYYDTRRILSYHIISQIGYMVMGLGIFTPLALAGGIFFMMHNMIAKTNTFLVAGMIARLKGTFYLKDVGGLFKQDPLVAVLFIIPAFALAGIPPLSGFFAKFVLIKAGIEAEQWVITMVAVLTGMLTLYSMIKIWNEAFLKKAPEIPSEKRLPAKLSLMELLPSILLGLISIAMGLFAPQIFDFTFEAANQLINPINYIEGVLNN
jgi:multicomponent Na+:H+ antiporter subunit D